MKTLNLSGFNRFLATLPLKIAAAELAGLTAAAELISEEARHEIGHYQRDNMGPSAEWEELAKRTKDDRRSKGFPENNPLLRTGELLHSISFHVEGNVAVVGSTSDVAVWQELGTRNIPPRSFLATAAYRKTAMASEAIAGRVVWVLRDLGARND